MYDAGLEGVHFNILFDRDQVRDTIAQMQRGAHRFRTQCRRPIVDAAESLSHWRHYDRHGGSAIEHCTDCDFDDIVNDLFVVHVGQKYTCECSVERVVHPRDVPWDEPQEMTVHIRVHKVLELWEGDGTHANANAGTAPG